jgi:hypothetical protein
VVLAFGFLNFVLESKTEPNRQKYLVLHRGSFANVNVVHDNWQVSLLRITMDLSGVGIWFLSILY